MANRMHELENDRLIRSACVEYIRTAARDWGYIGITRELFRPAAEAGNFRETLR